MDTRTHQCLPTCENINQFYAGTGCRLEDFTRLIRLNGKIDKIINAIGMTW